MAATLDTVIADIGAIQQQYRSGRPSGFPVWPMIILRSPKGWTGPKVVDGKPVEGTWRAHQVPVSDLEKPGHLKILEDWMRSYRPEELFEPAESWCRNSLSSRQRAIGAWERIHTQTAVSC